MPSAWRHDLTATKKLVLDYCYHLFFKMVTNFLVDKNFDAKRVDTRLNGYEKAGAAA